MRLKIDIKDNIHNQSLLYLGEFVYAITAAEDIIIFSLFIGRKQR